MWGIHIAPHPLLSHGDHTVTPLPLHIRLVTRCGAWNGSVAEVQIIRRVKSPLREDKSLSLLFFSTLVSMLSVFTCGVATIWS